MAELTIAELITILNTQELSHIPNTVVGIKVSDGVLELKLRDALLHAIVWRPLLQFGVPITMDDKYTVSPMTCRTISVIQSKQYAKMLDLLPTVNYLDIVMSMWEVIHQVYLLNFRHLAPQVQTTDLVSMVRIRKSPKMQEVINAPMPVDAGSRVFEDEIRRREAKMVALMKTPGALDDDTMLYSMLAGILKIKQVTQMFIAFGSRSDIDDRVLPHMIQNCGVRGMDSIADLFTESVSSKKTTHFNSTIIRDVQSWHREMRLYTCNLVDKLEGDCGRRVLLNLTVPKGKGNNYIDKIVELNGKTIAINATNCRDIETHQIGLVSPVFCNHVTGVCEHCAGRTTNHPWKYLPDVRIGGYGTSIICSSAAQKVLSAKHLIQVIAMLINMSEQARHYFSLLGLTDVKFDPVRTPNLEKIHLLISTANLGHLNDLGHEGITPEGFGHVQRVGVLNELTGEMDEFDLTQDEVVQHFSKYMLQHMIKYKDDIKIVNGYYQIPMRKFDGKKPVFTIVELNDDMKAYVMRIRKMFRSGIAECPNIHIAVSQIANLIHSKMDVNIFFIELVVKAIINSVLPDDGRHQFKKLGDGIAANNVATKLGHASVKRYLHSPGIVTSGRTESPFDSLYGW